MGLCFIRILRFRSAKVFRDYGGGSEVFRDDKAVAVVRLLGLGFVCEVKNMTESKWDLAQGHIFGI